MPSTTAPVFYFVCSTCVLLLFPDATIATGSKSRNDKTNACPAHRTLDEVIQPVHEGLAAASLEMYLYVLLVIVVSSLSQHFAELFK